MSNPSGYCKCGCGEKTKLATCTSKKHGTIKGQPNDYILHHHRRGSNNNNYNMGLTYNKTFNRWFIVCRDNSQVRYARAVMEAQLKRPLKSTEIVHHINSDPCDDRPENLFLCKSRFDHLAIEHWGYTKENMIKMLQETAEMLGRAPKEEELDKIPNVPNGRTYYSRFGGYQNALREAGLL